MSQDLSVKEILRRVVEASRRLESFERTTHRVTKKRSETTETNSAFIRVGSDTYKWSDHDDRIWPEELRYGGRRYVRGAYSAEWNTQENVALRSLTAERPPAWDEALFSEHYRVDFNNYVQAVRLPAKTVGGRRVIRLSHATSVPITLPSFDEMMKHLLPERMKVEDPNGKLEELRQQMAEAPDAMSLKEDLLIDEEDFMLLRVEVEGAVYRSGDIVESFVETRSHSKFNEAVLPGPLPE
jgi:hypothetical protein